MWDNTAMEGTADKSLTRRARPKYGRRLRLSRFLGIAASVAALALLAYVLLPSGQANLRPVVRINDVTLSVPVATNVGDAAGRLLALAQPGSTLDITGDVTTIGAGGHSRLNIQGRAIDHDTLLADGDVLEVGHGLHDLEGISCKQIDIPYKTVVEGNGAVVSLVQKGSTGVKEIHRGNRSGKQAAVVTIKPAKNMVVQRTSTARPGQKLAALTFDDGPGAYTKRVLDALASVNAPATFFVLGGNAAGQKSMIAAIRAAGHEVENHSWSHPVLTKLSAEEIQREITRTSNVLGGTRYLRPPYGSYDAHVTAAAAATGHRLVLWTVDTLDWKNRNADAILANVKAQTKPGAIILMHDGGQDRSATVAAIPRVVRWLFANGYSLTTVGRLLQG
jgi:peptidoglycan/xylan/chitin deacetylase (PgdA/CDA1 family)